MGVGTWALKRPKDIENSWTPGGRGAWGDRALPGHCRRERDWVGSGSGPSCGAPGWAHGLGAVGGGVSAGQTAQRHSCPWGHLEAMILHLAFS